MISAKAKKDVTVARTSISNSAKMVNADAMVDQEQSLTKSPANALANEDTS